MGTDHRKHHPLSCPCFFGSSFWHQVRTIRQLLSELIHCVEKIAVQDHMTYKRGTWNVEYISCDTFGIGWDGWELMRRMSGPLLLLLKMMIRTHFKLKFIGTLSSSLLEMIIGTHFKLKFTLEQWAQIYWKWWLGHTLSSILLEQWAQVCWKWWSGRLQAQVWQRWL